MPDTPKAKRPSRQQRGYDADWYRLRAEHLASNPVCVRCGGPATDVDHVQPFNGVDDPLRLDSTNLQSICNICHGSKTAEDQAAKPRQKPGPKPRYSAEEKVERNRAANREQSRKKAREGQDIGELPPVVDPARRERCRTDLVLALKTYFPGIFKDPFSADHLSIIAKMQLVIVNGGRIALAMPRGFGKTSIVECIAILAVLFGYRKYVVVIGASADAAKGISKSIRDEIEDNELLLADFPEAVYPLVCLEGEPRRCLGQTYKGQKTRTEWGQMQIKFPTMPGSPSSGAMIRSAGITGQIRGKKGKVKNDDATIEIFRPDLAIIDDPQTESSALSEVQCRNRGRVINQSILGLAGKKVNIAAIMPCTVIRKGDVADQHLDHKLRPEWNGSRFKMLYAWPKDLELWDQYKEIRLSFNPSIPGELEQAEVRATEFYIDHQREMDAGAVVAWEYAFRSNEVSAIQSAMNRHIDDPRGFAAECQQEPLPEENEGAAPLTAKEIAGKLNRLPRGHAPHTATHVTVAIDVQKDALYWMAVAWEANFTGYIIDYGAWPDQGRIYYRKADLTRTIAKETKVQGFEGQIYAALKALVTRIGGHNFSHGDGGQIRASRVLIDANYGQSTDTVYKFCLESDYASILLPIHGKGIGASARPMSQWPKHPGEIHDRNGQWIITKDSKRREIKYGLTDANAWKSFVYRRLAVAPGNPGALTLFGADSSIHQLVADHIAAEYPVETTANGRTINEWKLKPGADNEFFDTLCYNCAAASMIGVELPGATVPKPNQSEGRKSWSQSQREAKRRRA